MTSCQVIDLTRPGIELPICHMVGDLLSDKYKVGKPFVWLAPPLTPQSPEQEAGAVPTHQCCPVCSDYVGITFMLIIQIWARTRRPANMLFFACVFFVVVFVCVFIFVFFLCVFFLGGILLKYLYCLSRINLNSLVFTIRWTPLVYWAFTTWQQLKSY